MKSREVGLRIISEIESAFTMIDERQIDRFGEEILVSRRVFLFGLGRVLLVMKSFAMRLVHLGLTAHVLGDVTTPSAGKGDLLILGSGSGETETTLHIAKTGKALGVRLGLITTRARSRIGETCDFLVRIPAQAKTGNGETGSVQPMASLFEQTMLVFLDLSTLWIMERKGITAREMMVRHVNIE